VTERTTIDIGTESPPPVVAVSVSTGGQATVDLVGQTASVSVAGPTPVQVTASNGSIPPGGTTGQVLVKLSDADFDVGWQTLP
jgi:hypothetical protein